MLDMLLFFALGHSPFTLCFDILEINKCNKPTGTSKGI